MPIQPDCAKSSQRTMTELNGVQQTVQLFISLLLSLKKELSTSRRPKLEVCSSLEVQKEKCESLEKIDMEKEFNQNSMQVVQRQVQHDGRFELSENAVGSGKESGPSCFSATGFRFYFKGHKICALFLEDMTKLADFHSTQKGQFQFWMCVRSVVWDSIIARDRVDLVRDKRGRWVQKDVNQSSKWFSKNWSISFLGAPLESYERRSNFPCKNILYFPHCPENGIWKAHCVQSNVDDCSKCHLPGRKLKIILL